MKETYDGTTRINKVEKCSSSGHIHNWKKFSRFMLSITIYSKLLAATTADITDIIYNPSHEIKYDPTSTTLYTNS